ncbi:protein IWS1 homolog 1 [Ricinus communis]|uniref:Transcription factor IWS1, putative n=1 Tax=Ricinus communis TaxID=3988 RepID=B9S1I4_RICCO|nr:protein IWS1 homolog 1 [Ricinus communis]EEF42453.1 Transcription factor IWS1, putative [Ricinus communis]|eukprot:XP_002519849.1 protein IWS1 homolog 1 [Ricinus communis]
MAYEDDPYRDEDGEPLMDYDDIQSPEPQQQEDLLEDDVDGWGEQERERSQTPVYNNNDKVEKPRKRLVKKSNSGIGEKGHFVVPELVDEDEVDDEGFGRKRKTFGKDFHEKSKKKFSKGEKKYSSSGGKGGSSSKLKGKMARKEDGEVKEMWDTIAGGDSEDDHDGVRTMDDDNFIDDSGVDPADRYGSDNEPRSPTDAPQAEEGEEDEEIKELFKMGKKKKKNEKSPAEIALLVENVMAELEVTAEEDAELNRRGKPAITKLKKLPLLTEVLSKKQLQQEFIDHGVLTLLKNWLEPLPDGSLPNINIRAAILKILTDFPIDLEQYDRREQLKKSGLGKVIMFLSKSDEETTSNRKLAKDLVDKWSRPIFNKSTRFEDMRNIDDDRAFRRPTVRRPVNNSAGMESRDGDLDLDISRERRSGQSSARQQHASRPEATPLDFLVRPQSKIDPEEVRARAKQVVQDQRRLKMNKKLQQLKAPKKKQLQATKLSVEGRGMLKYL